MTRHFDTVTRYAECDADDVAVLPRAAVAALRNPLNELAGRIAQAQDDQQPPSTMAGVQLRHITEELARLLDPTRPDMRAVCTWSGQVDQHYVSGTPETYEVRWTCPACTTEHHQTRHEDVNPDA